MSLIVLCPHCLTWIESYGQTCTECGVEVNIDDIDLPSDELDRRLGECLTELGDVKVLRRGWPTNGRLLASTEGLLFVPQFGVQPNGALEAVAEGDISGTERRQSLFQWWSRPVWRRTAPDAAPRESPTSGKPLRDLLYNSPGAVYIERTTIRRIIARWGRVQIERRSARMVSITPLATGANLRDSFRKLMDYPEWRSIVAEI